MTAVDRAPARRPWLPPAAAAVAAEPRTGERLAGGYWVLLAALVLLPFVGSDFVLVQIMGWAFVLGMVALSLMFLAGYGGMVSLSQMTVAGIAAYMVAIFGSSAIAPISLGWPWWATIPIALAIATLFGSVVGALAVRTAGIYTIMITLAVAAAFFYFVRQNYPVFNGFTGFNDIRPPHLFGVDWRRPVPFYYLAGFWAVASFAAVTYVARSPFGLALQGVRDNPRRMAALGFNVTAHRVAAYAFASLIAAIAGVLQVWLNGQISPGSVAVGPAIDILVIAVVGGIGTPIGPFIGAVVYVLLRTFALDALVAVGLSGERFELLIGAGFLVVVLLSPDGLVGIWTTLREQARRTDRLTGRAS